MNSRLLFRIFYTTFFTILTIVLLGLLLITPADAIRQALDNHQPYNVFVIAGGYFLTIATGSIIYASRLYTNRTVLAAIPKTWIPVEKGDVNKRVRKMIVSSLNRSAAIAWDSRPRVTQSPTIVSGPDARESIAKSPTTENYKEDNGIMRKSTKQSEKDEQTVTIPPHPSVWGEISHNGWSSPTSPDLPSLQYMKVILELPHLIEAKAVSFAPLDPKSTTDSPMADPSAVNLLQRPASMGLRDYISHLISVGIIKFPSISINFLTAYESARFSQRPLSEPEFRALMNQFAEVLRSMQALDPVILALSKTGESESDIDDDASSSSTPRSRSLLSSRSVSMRSDSQGTVRTAPSRRTNATDTHTFHTAPATPRSRKIAASRSPSANSFAQSRRPYAGSSSSSSSTDSLRSQESVIKLSRANKDSELPYILTIPGLR
ncbi:hypothetical protein B7494_g8278 [Chlorociboria aeruginascens]|nr:hypothetical protein B7494_g8278 [Chlorociboria aeruginascens]